MAAQRKHPEELRERAVKMVLEVRERAGAESVRAAPREILKAASAYFARELDPRLPR